MPRSRSIRAFTPHAVRAVRDLRARLVTLAFVLLPVLLAACNKSNGSSGY
jgi:hypothetical protein